MTRAFAMRIVSTKKPLATFGELHRGLALMQQLRLEQLNFKTQLEAASEIQWIIARAASRLLEWLR